MLEETPAPDGHAWPHVPQLFTSLARSTPQSWFPTGPHVAYPAVHWHWPVALHEPWPEHTGVVEHDGDGGDLKKHQGVLPPLLTGDQQQPRDWQMDCHHMALCYGRYDNGEDTHHAATHLVDAHVAAVCAVARVAEAAGDTCVLTSGGGEHESRGAMSHSQDGEQCHNSRSPRHDTRPVHCRAHRVLGALQAGCARRRE